MWIVQLLFFLWVMYMVMRPEYFFIMLVQGINLAHSLYWWSKKLCQRAKRFYLLKTKTFEERPVMKPPSLKTIVKKKF